MTILLHGAMSAVITYHFTRREKAKWYAIPFFAFLGILPDLIGWIQGLFNPALRWDGLYKEFHNITNWWVHLIPFTNIHAWIDYFMHLHKEPYGWVWWGAYLEIFFWLLILIYGVHLWKKML